MKNIVIGLTRPSWEVASSGRYYAQRGGADYAFGSTPAEALEQLECREKETGFAHADDIADEIAFLALGAAEALRNRCGANLDAYGGHMGFIAEVTRHARMIEDRWNQLPTGEFEGVWLYDVAERFGHEWAEMLLDNAYENPADFLEYIVRDEMEKWQ